jgi:hypothetical protein
MNGFRSTAYKRLGVGTFEVHVEIEFDWLTW